MNPSFTLPSPAKLNLFLHVLDRRDDGYHNLQTLFQLLDVGDELSFQLGHRDEIRLYPRFAAIEEEDNLVVKAARRLQAHCDCRRGANIVLAKRLPIGGGIGGGSSNAATTLLALNKLWELELNIDELAALGRELGADVPVFVRGHTAWAEGVGERLQNLSIPPQWYLVVAPRCQVSTAAIFAHKDLTRNSIAIKVRAFLEEGGRNDCQPLVERLFPPVKDAVEWLSRYAPAQLTGTGACVFAPFASLQEAKSVLAQRPENVDGFIARGVDKSPLHQRLRI